MHRTFLKVFVLAIFSLSFFSHSAWAEDAEPAVAPKAIYYKFPEPFTINFLRQSNQTVRYLQIKMTIMSYEQEVIDNAELNLPMLQDELRTLFTEQTMETVNSVEGRRSIQAAALETIKTLLKEETGNDKVDGVYFTSFVLQ